MSREWIHFIEIDHLCYADFKYCKSESIRTLHASAFLVGNARYCRCCLSNDPPPVLLSTHLFICSSCLICDQSRWIIPAGLPFSSSPSSVMMMEINDTSNSNTNCELIVLSAFDKYFLFRRDYRAFARFPHSLLALQSKKLRTVHGRELFSACCVQLKKLNDATLLIMRMPPQETRSLLSVLSLVLTSFSYPPSCCWNS